MTSQKSVSTQEMSHEQMAAIAAVYAKHFLAQPGGQKKNKIKECAISLNHKEEGEDTVEGGDCLLCLSQTCFMWAATSHPPCGHDKCELTGQQWLKT